MFRIEMLPAAHGDCLWIEYGSGDTVHRILIDGGPAHTYPALRERILHLPAEQRHFDLLVITHIDGDHIEGAIRLLQDAEDLRCEFDRIWFNGRDQLNKVPDPAGEPLGALQGEYLGLLIADYEARTDKTVLNIDFDDQLAAIDRDKQTLPIVADFPGDCRITLLSPDYDRLLELKDRWAEELRKANVESGDEQTLRYKMESNRQLRPLGDVLGVEDETMEDNFEFPDPDDLDLLEDLYDTLGGGSDEAGSESDFGSDTSKANGSSIAFLLEYPKDSPKVKFLFSGDAWSSVLETSIKQLVPRANKRLSLTGFKIPHHGSVGNLTESLLDKLSCKHYLISTSGAKFRHPHERVIELLLQSHHNRAKPRLHFNYLTKTTEFWSDETDQKTKDYKAFHPKGISLEL